VTTFTQSSVVGDKLCRVWSDAINQQFCFQKFKSRFLCRIFIHEEEILVGLCKSYLQANAGNEVLRDVTVVTMYNSIPLDCFNLFHLKVKPLFVAVAVTAAVGSQGSMFPVSKYQKAFDR
jgi:hypothetical protein